jgi:hypothetical protein
MACESDFTDLGRTGIPSRADGLRLFMTHFINSGIGTGDISAMGHEVTGHFADG